MSIPESLQFETAEAVEISEETLVGFNNCFSVMTSQRKHYKIVNFYAEALRSLLHDGLTWPVKIAVLGEKWAAIHDTRIPRDKYCQSFCEICTPTELLPIPQRLRMALDIASGRLKFHEKEIAHDS